MRYYEGARSHRINEWIGIDGGCIKTSLRPFAVRKSILLVWQCYQPSTNTHAHNLFESTLIFTHKYFAFDFFFFHSAISIPIFVLSSMYSSVYSFSSTYTRPSYSINSQNIIIAQNFFSVFIRFFFASLLSSDLRNNSNVMPQAEHLCSRWLPWSMVSIYISTSVFMIN